MKKETAEGISRASVAELEEIVDLARQFHEEDGHPLADSGPKALEMLLRGSRLGEVFVIRAEKQMVGYFVLCFTMSVEFGGLVVILDDLYIRPNFRSQGWGSKALAFTEALAFERRAVQIFLEVEIDNQKAFEIYRSRGFRRRERNMMEKLI